MIYKRIERPLVGQKALVTGANSGIGKGIAFSLAAAGADVIINYLIDTKSALEVSEEIKKMGVNSFIHQADISSEQDVLAMYKKILNEWGTIDILVNNAGIQRDAPFEELTLEQWNSVINVNLTGAFLCSREAVKEFKRRGIRSEISCSAGKIFYISSVHEVIPWAGHVNYAASKGGLSMMMKSLAQEVAAHGIRVVGVCPGAIRTPINKEAWSTEENYANLMKLIPAKRIGEIHEVGKVISWLASDEADYIIGASIFIDGGMTLYPGFETGG